MENIRRIFVEKKEPFAVEAKSLCADLQNNLGINGIKKIRIINRYDVTGLNDEEFLAAKNLVLSEPPVDNVYLENLPNGKNEYVFAVELLPGQYDQREDFAEQCIQLITQKNKPVVASAKVFVIEGNLTKKDLETIKKYCINPVEAQEAKLEKPLTLSTENESPQKVKVLDNFRNLTKDEAENLRQEMGLAMSLADLLWCQKYFKDEEMRDPTITEIKVLDTYWSDHCRHTTFMTEIDDIKIEEGKYSSPVQDALEKYKKARTEVYGKETKRPITLMDIACIETKKLKKQGVLFDFDESEEINACSILRPITVNDKKEDWLIMFKNETHNHPTEIEPFGGAATCLGGAIRDPLSGRSYVYQAMRITGAADPRVKISETLPGKLPQRKITLGAAAGYSSYGNQIGLTTGYVHEYYHPRFVAKRMEIGAVMGAVPASAVRREKPIAGDIVVLLGGRTGRDGCGGATGASKEHTLTSLANCGAEVQKGNAPTERKLQRLFRNFEVTKMIKRCNDFGAGGVAVAIGELTDGLNINLDLVPKKYTGLDGTELAISESQERMAVVIAENDREKFIAYAHKENLEATVVANVTDTGRLEMYWQGEKIVNLSRKFLDTNGVSQHAKLIVAENNLPSQFDKIPEEVSNAKTLQDKWLANLRRLNVCSQKGLAERFDSTIGRGTVQMPFGGKNQLTPMDGMIARIPILNGKTNAASIMACGFNPDVACWSPFHGAMYAVTEAVVRAVTMGANPNNLRLTLQEYFGKLHDEKSWGEPFAALLGAFVTLDALKLSALGGKDSMSGTFMDKTVPPTLVAFAVDVTEGEKTISPEFKKAGNKIIFVPCPRDKNDVLNFEILQKNLNALHLAINDKKIFAAAAVKEGGIAALVSTLAFGNNLGFGFDEKIKNSDALFTLQPGAYIAEIAEKDIEKYFGDVKYLILGEVLEKNEIRYGKDIISQETALENYVAPLQEIFPDKLPKVSESKDILQPFYKNELPLTAPYSITKPRVFIPVFPGINCEYDSVAAFTAAGAEAETFVVRNLTPNDIEESVDAMVKLINNSQIVMIPGGFSAGDEPDGSGKFIATMLRNPRIKEAITKLLNERDGLMLGICNGFQALIKLGLVPFGEIRAMDEFSPTLTFNNIGRHVSQIVRTKIISNKSPWFSACETGEIHSVAVSHGEGRFYAPDDIIKKLFVNGQVATQYVDNNNQPTMNTPFNPNGSLYAIESITSLDGRVLGKMGHSERFTEGLFQNIDGEKDQKIFLSGVKYFQ